MPDTPDRQELPEATVVPRSRARISAVWVIPALALIVAVGIFVQRLLSEGPTITIVFKVAEGMEAGKTLVKYKDVAIGQVTAVRLSPDYAKVEVTAKMAKSAAGLMVEDAKFWVVEPRVTLSGVSGLGTLLSGNYIGFEMGKSTKAQRTFAGLETPPPVASGQAGRQVVLRADALGSLGIGSPVYYRSLQAGQVIGYGLAPDGRAIDVRVFVNAPFDQYIREGTRFWNVSGLEASIGASGVDVHVQSLVALIAGGLTFETPAIELTGAPAPDTMVFTLYTDRAAAMKQPDRVSQRYVLYVNESLRGLSVGAPVTLLGLPAGEVTAVGLDIDPSTNNVRGRVDIVSFPERLAGRLSKDEAGVGAAMMRSERERHALLQRLVERRGLRAQLQSGNLITGQLYVALEFFPNAAPAKVDWNQPVPVLPTVPSTLPNLEAKLSNILVKLEKLPIEAIGADVTKVLASVNGAVQDAGTVLSRVNTDVTPELRSVLEDARRLLASADGLLNSGLPKTLDGVNATLGDIQRLLVELRGPIATADLLLKNTDATLLGQQSPVQQDLRDALQEVSRAARSLRVLMDYLERHPDSLLRGKTEVKP